MSDGPPDDPSREGAAGSTCCPPLRGDAQADVAIVGGGYVGLNAAIGIVRQAPGCRVTVLERACCGSGASGRNGGQVHSWWERLEALTAVVGQDEAKWLADESVAAIDTLADLSSRRPEVGFQRGGWVWTATTPAQLGRWTRAVERCTDHGSHPFRELPLDELRQRTGTAVTVAGVVEERGGTLRPEGLAKALRAEALDAGVTVCERSPVRAITAGPPSVLSTPAGTLTAERVVLAPNAWAARLPELRRWLYVVGSDIVLTAPISIDDSAHAPQAGTAVCDSQPRVLYWARTRDGRIAFGRGGGNIAPFNRLGARFESRTPWARDAESALRRVYPHLAHVPVERAWTGPVDRTADGLPVFGSLGGRDGPVYGVGWSGSGVAGSVLGGRVLAALALRHADAWSENGLVNRTPPSLPPEPLRTAGAVIVRTAVRRAGRAEDRGTPVGWLTRRIGALAPSGAAARQAVRPAAVRTFR